MVRCGPNRTRDKDFHVFPNVVTRAKRGRINSEIAYGAARVERSEVIRFQSFVFEVASDAPDHFIDGRSAEVVECCLGIKDEDEQVRDRLSRAIVCELDFHGRLLGMDCSRNFAGELADRWLVPVFPYET